MGSPGSPPGPLAFAGVFWQAFFVVALTGVETAAPPEMSGRELGLFYTLTLGGLAVGTPLTGLLLDRIGVQAGLIAVGVLMLGFAAWRMLRLRRRLRAASAEA